MNITNKKKRNETSPKIKQKNLILDIIPIRDTKDGYYITNTGIIDLYQIKCKSISQASDFEIANQINRLAYFFRRYTRDFKIVAMCYPTNTSLQRDYLNHKILDCKNDKHINFLQQKLYALEFLEENRTDKEFYLMIFAADKKQHQELKELVWMQSSLSIMEIPIEKKNQLIFKLNNQNSKIRL